MTDPVTPTDGDLPGLAAFPVRRPYPTRWADNDAYGHLNNVVYYELFDTAVNGWLIETCDVDIRTLPAIGVVAETLCRYLRQTSFPDVLHIGLALEHRGRTSVVYRLATFREDPDTGLEDAPCALGRFVHVYVDAETRRPVPIPDEITAALTKRN
ncbi:acyl-CoA thioesterase [Streptomyces sp. NPDC051217]|uniref:acyl-CoA thioesterase n=1 Tax=Streptomyces sp. NPDC051217 TaxID=3365644 RepID=UPI003790A183